MINEFAGQDFTCSTLIPAAVGAYANAAADGRACSAVGSTLGSDQVSGSAYIEKSYQYEHAHKWRNFGILLGFLIFFLGVYIVATGQSALRAPVLRVSR